MLICVLEADDTWRGSTSETETEDEDGQRSIRRSPIRALINIGLGSNYRRVLSSPHPSFTHPPSHSLFLSSSTPPPTFSCVPASVTSTMANVSLWSADARRPPRSPHSTRTCLRREKSRWDRIWAQESPISFLFFGILFFFCALLSLFTFSLQLVTPFLTVPLPINI